MTICICGSVVGLRWDKVDCVDAEVGGKFMSVGMRYGAGRRGTGYVFGLCGNIWCGVGGVGRVGGYGEFCASLRVNGVV